MVTSSWSISGFPVLLQGPIALGQPLLPILTAYPPLCLLFFLTPTFNCPHVLQLLQKSIAEVFPFTCFSSQPLPTDCYNTAANQSWLGFQEFTQLLPKPISRHFHTGETNQTSLFLFAYISCVPSVAHLPAEQFPPLLPKAWFQATFLAGFNSPLKFLFAASPLITKHGQQR